MDGSSTQHLNEGNNEEMSSQVTKKGRSKNFSIQEDMLLISAWENVSLDTIKGSTQSQGGYWSRMKTYYDAHKSFTTERTATALSNRWSTIQKCVKIFQGFYSEIEGRNQSGICEADKVRQAMEMYQNIQKCAFAFLHCWTELRNSPKFTSNVPEKRVSKKRVRASSNDNSHTVGSSQSPVSVEGGLDKEEGLECAAERVDRMEAETRNEASTAFFTNMREYMSASAIERRKEYENMIKVEEELLELKKKQMRISEAREKREQQIYEASIMAIDVTKMDPQQAQFYNSIKAEILGKRR